MIRIVMALFLLSSASVFADTVWTKDNKIVEGSKITVKLKENRILVIKDGVPQPVKMENIKAVQSPKPSILKTMEKKYYEGKYEFLAKHGATAVKKVQPLGWGYRAAYLYSMSLIKTKKYSDAYRQALLAKGSGKQGGYIKQSLDSTARDTALADIILTYVAIEKNDLKKAKSRIRGIRKQAEGLGAYYYNLQGAIFQKEGLENPALLEYYKSIFLDSANVYEARIACDNAIAIIGAGKPRAKFFTQQKSQLK